MRVSTIFSCAALKPGWRRRLAAAALAALLAAAPPAGAGEGPTLLLRQHRFVPGRIVVPAHQTFRLRVQNADETAESFRSSSLNRARLVQPGATVTLHLGPLEPGDYPFFGDFHQTTAHGILVAQ